MFASMCIPGRQDRFDKVCMKYGSNLAPCPPPPVTPLPPAGPLPHCFPRAVLSDGEGCGGTRGWGFVLAGCETLHNQQRIMLGNYFTMEVWSGEAGKPSEKFNYKVALPVQHYGRSVD